MVVEHVGIDHLTQCGAYGATSGSTDQADQHGTGDGAQDGTTRASRRAQGTTDFGAANDTGNAAGSSCDRSNDAASLLTEIAGNDAHGTAVRAG